MKALPVMVIVCVVMTLTGADAPPEEKSSDVQTAEGELVKRSFCYSCWYKYNNRYLRYVSTPMTWAKAEKYCRDHLGGTLASVRNSLDHHLIRSLILRASNRNRETWIGGSDAQEENVWLWSDGRPFRYTYWCHGQPNNYHSKQDCIVMNFGASGCWNDYWCNFRRPFVCVRKY